MYVRLFLHVKQDWKYINTVHGFYSIGLVAQLDCGLVERGRLSKVYREVYLRSPQVIKGHEQADTKADINASVLKKSGDSIIIDFL
jgi:hypothetical protein